MTRPSPSQPCPCGLGPFAQCCGRYLGGAQVPANAQQLMRSRYTAFVLRDEAYLRASWHPDTCPDGPLCEDGIKWLGLELLRHQEDGDGRRATVEFVARYKVNGRAQRLHEVSRFVRDGEPGGRWRYLDGSFPGQ
jgi:SEC-C motif-containing protein